VLGLVAVPLAFQASATTPPPTFVVNSTGDAHDATLNGACDTGNLVGEQHECTLRAAIQESNKWSGSGRPTIDFNIPGDGVQTISPSSALPLITRPVVIDGTSQPGFAAAGHPLVELSGD
jgi:CSLREA domain-containing protein